MLPPGGKDNPGFRKIIVGNGNSDPFPEHKGAINVLGKHFSIGVDKESCYPYSHRAASVPVN